ncbi:hypothetical protein E1264_03510 [Actinomadura sp. KC216]|uniref:Gp37-like protein n=1 Tax=Actinomadura sp. KC216 TaxID=2530370 RepID=UPI00104B7288|nr:hypothetical protein [Actinomadura sp. KC216]TDB90905.1 hypothetical protein E1264_03510 [Actinomadura sp. KC216]
MSEFRVYLREAPKNPDWRMPLIAELDEYNSVEAIIRHLAIGSFTIEMPSSSTQARLIKPGRGVVIFIEGQTTPVFTGPITSIKSTKTKDDPGTLTVNGSCDNMWFDERIARNDAEDTWNRETEGDWDGELQIGSTLSLVAENSAEWIWHLVLQNFKIPYVDTFNDLSRRIPFMELPNEAPSSATSLPNDDLWKGFSGIHLKSIAEPVFELSRRANLDTRFYWDPTTEKIHLRVAPATDKSGTVVFDEQVGNLVGQQIVSEAPSATRVTLSGATPTDANPRRYYRYVKNNLHNPPGWSDPGWGREAIEAYWNRTTEAYADVRDTKWHPNVVGGVMPEPPNNSVEDLKFDTAATVYFVENGVKGQISLDVQDIPTCTFGVHYGIGNVVRVLIDTSILPPNIPDSDGVLRQQVQEVRLGCKAEEMWTIKPTIGTESSSSTPYVYRELRRLRRLVEKTNERI